MKPLHAVLVTVVLGAAVSQSGFAQAGRGGAEESYFGKIDQIHVRFGHAVTGYRECLKSDNPGVVGSALAYVAYLKLHAPECDFSILKPEINRLALFGSTPSLRYRAYLTGLLLDSPSVFATESVRNAADGDELFQGLSAILQKSLMGSNDRKYVWAE